jgi:hypothetical protein
LSHTSFHATRRNHYTYLGMNSQAVDKGAMGNEFLLALSLPTQTL